MLLVILVCWIKYGSSQAVNVEIFGKDTFPMAIVYHGVPVSIFTDNQTTTIAQIFDNAKFLRQQLNDINEVAQQYVNIINQDSVDRIALQQKLDSVKLQFKLSEENQANLQTSIKAAAEKAKAEKGKFVIRMSTSIVASFIVGVLVTTAYFIIHK